VFTAVIPAPVEYSAAVERFLEGAGLTDASRRIYRIALTTWAWALVARDTPKGTARRGASPPMVPLARLDSDRTPARLARAFAEREAVTGARTANRELAILRSALAWWREQGWIEADPTRRLQRRRSVPAAPPKLTERQAAAVLALPAPIREQTFWHLVYESGGGIERILALDVPDIDRHHFRTRANVKGEALHWQPGTARLLSLLIAGRASGPVFLTDRKAPVGTPLADVCRVTGRGRLSYRRAAELFTEGTRELDPQTRGWTLRQLQNG
jgi:integrase/recombinase XerD